MGFFVISKCKQRKEENHAQCPVLKHTLKRMLRAACYSKSTHIEKQDHTALGETLFSEKQCILKAQTLFLATNSNVCLRRGKNSSCLFTSQYETTLHKSQILSIC